MKTGITLLICLFLYALGFAQDKASKDTVNTSNSKNNLEISGYIQAEFQYGEKDAALKVGSKNTNKNKSFNRIGVRRGRVKLKYTHGIATGVFQVDLTEKGFSLKDAYIHLIDPWLHTFSLYAGVFTRPFGYELEFSSAKRQSPEYSKITTTLFPDVRDIGAMLTVRAPKTSNWHFLTLKAGLFAGNGVELEIDNKRDFIGQLYADIPINENFKIRGGVSYYYGNVYQGTKNVFSIKNQMFSLYSDSSNIGSFAKREYFGFDLQVNIASILGHTKILGEYIFGTQPGRKLNSKSPNSSSLPSHDLYIRNFQGGYAMLVQQLGNLPVSAIVKYNLYDPNVAIAGDAIGKNYASIGDIQHQSIGCGLIWDITKNLRAMAYYNFIQQEKTTNIVGYETDREDDVFTFRLQYAF